LTEPTADPTPGRTRHAARSLLLAVTLLAYTIALRSLLSFDGSSGSSMSGSDELFFEPTGSSPRLIFAVTAMLLVARWPRLREGFGTGGAPVLAVALLAAGSSLAGWAHYIDRPELHIPSLSLVLVGLSAGFSGRAGARIAVFPALFLLLALPIPRVLVNQLMYPLQLATASLTTAILRLLGTQVIQYGEMIATQDRLFQVIESCSGLRGVITMLMTAMVYIELFRRRRSHAALLLLASPVIGLVLNQLRILSIIANPYAADETIHAAQGIAMVVVGVLGLAVLDRLLVRWLPRPRRREPKPRRHEEGPASIIGPALAAIFAATLLAFTFAATPWLSPADTAMETSSFPGAIEAWHSITRRPIAREFLGSIGFDRCALRDYVRDGDDPEGIELLICTDRRTNGGDRMLSHKLWVPGPGWALTPAGELAIPGWPRSIDVSVARRREEARLVAHWRAGAQPIVVEIARGALGLDRGPFRRPDRAVAVRVSATLSGGNKATREARERIKSFLENARPSLVDMGALDENS